MVFGVKRYGVSVKNLGNILEKSNNHHVIKWRKDKIDSKNEQIT